MDEYQNFVINRRINRGRRAYKQLNENCFQLKQGSPLTLLPVIPVHTKFHRTQLHRKAKITLELGGKEEF